MEKIGILDDIHLDKKDLSKIFNYLAKIEKNTKFYSLNMDYNIKYVHMENKYIKENTTI